jgi:hypothetical protein
MKNNDDRHDKREGWRLRKTTIMGIRANNNYLGKHDCSKKRKGLCEKGKILTSKNLQRHDIMFTERTKKVDQVSGAFHEPSVIIVGKPQ